MNGKAVIKLADVARLTKANEASYFGHHIIKNSVYRARGNSNDSNTCHAENTRGSPVARLTEILGMATTYANKAVAKAIINYETPGWDKVLTDSRTQLALFAVYTFRIAKESRGPRQNGSSIGSSARVSLVANRTCLVPLLLMPRQAGNSIAHMRMQ